VVRASFWILLLTGALCAALLMLPRYLGPPHLGQAITAAVVLYHLLLIMGAWLRSHHELLSAYAFLLPLSFCLVLPDMMLVQVLGVLTFPDFGAPRYGSVPVYMAGLWVAPLLLVVWAGELAHRYSGALGALVALLASVAVFGAAEWAVRFVTLWHPRNVDTWQGVALYVVPAEALLGLVTWMVFANVAHRTIFTKAAAAALVAMFYAGALFVSHLAFQRYL
jgi:hypothetical protein